MYATQAVPSGTEHQSFGEITEVDAGRKLGVLLELIDVPLHVAVPNFHRHVVAGTSENVSMVR